MKKFSDFNVSVPIPMTGEKIKISKILNTSIVLLDYKLQDSKFPKNKSGKCLQIQIKIENETRVVFTGSDILIAQIEQIPKTELPIECKIVQQGEHYEFK